MKPLRVRFVEDLILRRKVRGDGHLFYTDRPYRIEIDTDLGLLEYVVPEDRPTDLASIPTLIPRFVAQKVDVHIEAAVVHDDMYRRGLYDKDFADAVFLLGMEEAKVPWWRRRLMWAGVRLFGRGAYDD